MKKSALVAMLYLIIIFMAYSFQFIRLLIQKTANDIAVEYFFLALISVLLRAGSHLFSVKDIRKTFQSEHLADKLLFWGDIIVIVGLVANLILIIYYGGDFIWGV